MSKRPRSDSATASLLEPDQVWALNLALPCIPTAAQEALKRLLPHEFPETPEAHRDKRFCNVSVILSFRLDVILMYTQNKAATSYKTAFDAARDLSVDYKSHNTDYHFELRDTHIDSSLALNEHVGTYPPNNIDVSQVAKILSRGCSDVKKQRVHRPPQ
jgi:hypothetical protein